MGLTTQKVILERVLDTESEKKYRLELHDKLVKDVEDLRRASFVTSTGCVEYRSGYLIKYPLDIAWARLQALFNRSRGSYDVLSVPFVLKYSQRYATRKYWNAQEAMLGTLLVCSVSDVSTIAKSLFRHLRASKSLAGFESSYLGIMNTLGRRNDPLFQEGASLWPQLATTCTAESVILIDKELSSILVVSGSKVPSLGVNLKKPGINDMSFMGGPREIDYEAVVNSINQAVIGNPIEVLISERVAAVDGEGMCKAVVQGAIAGGVAICGSSAGPVGTIAGGVVGAGAGYVLGEMACGWFFSKDNTDTTTTTSTTTPTDAGTGVSAGTRTDSSTADSDQADTGTQSSNATDSTSNSTDSQSCNPDTQSCPDDDTTAYDDDGDDDDEMPNSDSDDWGGPRSLGLNLERTSSLAVGDGLISLIAVGPDGINMLNGLPAVDIASKTVYSLGIAVSSPAVHVTNKRALRADAWKMHTKDWSAVVGVFANRPAFANLNKTLLQ